MEPLMFGLIFLPPSGSPTCPGSLTLACAACYKIGLSPGYQGQAHDLGESPVCQNQADKSLSRVRALSSRGWNPVGLPFSCSVLGGRSRALESMWSVRVLFKGVIGIIVPSCLPKRLRIRHAACCLLKKVLKGNAVGQVAWRLAS